MCNPLGKFVGVFASKQLFGLTNLSKKNGNICISVMAAS